MYINTKNKRTEVRRFPYGMTAVLPIVLSTLAVMFYYISAFGCKTFAVEDKAMATPGNFTDVAPTFEENENRRLAVTVPAKHYKLYVTKNGRYFVGYWGAEVVDGREDKACKSFSFLEDDPQLDAVMRFGRAVTVVGSLAGTAFWFLFVTLTFVRYPEFTLKTALGFSYSMAAFTGLLLLGLEFWGNGYNMEVLPGPTGYLIIPTFFMWIAAPTTALMFLEESEDQRKKKKKKNSSSRNKTTGTKRGPGDEEGDEDDDGDDPEIAAMLPASGKNKKNRSTVEEIVHNADGTTTKTTTEYVDDVKRGGRRVSGKTVEIDDVVVSRETTD